MFLDLIAEYKNKILPSNGEANYELAIMHLLGSGFLLMVQYYNDKKNLGNLAKKIKDLDLESKEYLLKVINSSNKLDVNVQKYIFNNLFINNEKTIKLNTILTKDSLNAHASIGLSCDKRVFLPILFYFLDYDKIMNYKDFLASCHIKLEGEDMAFKKEFWKFYFKTIFNQNDDIKENFLKDCKEYIKNDSFILNNNDNSIYLEFIQSENFFKLLFLNNIDIKEFFSDLGNKNKEKLLLLSKCNLCLFNKQKHFNFTFLDCCLQLQGILHSGFYLELISHGYVTTIQDIKDLRDYFLNQKELIDENNDYYDEYNQYWKYINESIQENSIRKCIETKLKDDVISFVYGAFLLALKNEEDLLKKLIRIMIINEIGDVCNEFCMRNNNYARLFSAVTEEMKMQDDRLVLEITDQRKKDKEVQLKKKEMEEEKLKKKREKIASFIKAYLKFPGLVICFCYLMRGSWTYHTLVDYYNFFVENFLNRNSKKRLIK